MKEISLIKNRVVRGEIELIVIIANSKKSGKILEKYLKEEFEGYKLSYRIVTKLKTSDGIRHDNRSVTVLWGSWWKNKEMLEYVGRNLTNTPGVRAICSIESRWLYDA